MGYAHYFSNKKLTNKEWNRITADVIKLFDAYEGELDVGDFDNRKVAERGDDLFTEDTIWFNGHHDGHETFVIQRAGGDDFCKTARKPYDLMVCACLMVCNWHCADKFDIGSDGDKEDWTEAFDFVTGALGEEYVMKFIMEIKL